MEGEKKVSNQVWDIEGEGEARYEPDEIDILEELYTQERMANDYLIDQLKALAGAEPHEALDGIRNILEQGFIYFGEQRPWDRPALQTLIGQNQQLDLFEETVQ